MAERIDQPSDLPPDLSIFPGLDDYLHDGLVPPCVSKFITPHWQRPIPGPSLDFHVGKRQMRFRTYPEDSGSIYTPPPGTVCEWTRDYDPNEAVSSEPAGQSTQQCRLEAALVRLHQIDHSQATVLEGIELARDEMRKLRGDCPRSGESRDEGLSPSCAPPQGDCPRSGESRDEGLSPLYAQPQGRDDSQNGDSPSTRAARDLGTVPSAARETKTVPFKNIHVPSVRTPRADAGDCPPPKAEGLSPSSGEQSKSENAAVNDGSTKDGDSPSPRAPRETVPSREITPDDTTHIANNFVREVDRAIKPVARGIAKKIDFVRLIEALQRGGLIYARLAEIRYQAALELIAIFEETSRKHEFLQNRAVAISYGMLCAMEEKFRDIGFGAWMPFRYPDQWLQMTSLMQKLLVANGLLTPKGPNQWRDFLENTPEPEFEEKIGPHGKVPMPKSWAIQPRCKEITSMQALIERAWKESKARHKEDEFLKTFRDWKKNQESRAENREPKIESRE